MREQALSPAERCPALSVDAKPLGVLDIRDTLEVLFRAGKMSGGAAIQLLLPRARARQSLASVLAAGAIGSFAPTSAGLGPTTLQA